MKLISEINFESGAQPRMKRTFYVERISSGSEAFSRSQNGPFYSISKQNRWKLQFLGIFAHVK